MIFTDVDTAFAFARTKHASHRRKHADVPYFCHLLGTAAKVQALGGSDLALAAAFLHDTIEDVGVTVAELNRRFSPALVAIVVDLTEPVGQPYAVRKAAYLRQLAETGYSETLLVSACDKRDNLMAYHDQLASTGAAPLTPSKLGFYGAVLRTIDEHPLCQDAVRAAVGLLLDTYATLCARLGTTPLAAQTAFQQILTIGDQPPASA